MKSHHDTGNTPTDPDQASAHDLPTQIRRFIKAHQSGILGAGIAILIVLTVFLVAQRRDRRALQAVEHLARARGVEDYEDIVERFGRTPAAPLALLQAARQHYETGAIQRALSLYDQFFDAHSDHPLAETARLGRLHCYEATGRVDEALRGFNEFLESTGQHPLRPQAVLGKARCLITMGNYEQAEIVYEDFIALNPDSRWLPQVEQGLRDLRRRLRAMDSPSSANVE